MIRSIHQWAELLGSSGQDHRSRTVPSAPVGFLSAFVIRASSFLIFILLATFAQATPTKLGDLDDDGVFTANDLAKLVGHSSGTAPLPSNARIRVSFDSIGVNDLLGRATRWRWADGRQLHHQL